MQQGKQTKRLPGFYIAVCCCVIAIGIAGFFAQSYNETETTTAINTVSETSEPYARVETALTEDYGVLEDAAEVSSADTIFIEDTAAAESAADNEAAEYDAPHEDENASAEAAEYEIDNPDLMSAAAIVETAENAVLADPVPNMRVLDGFSGDTLMYNDALGDWRTHNGIDVEADIGGSVAAAASGTVTEVSGGTRGGRVVIEHDGGLITVYEQLRDICVNEGDTVTQAEVIGMIDDSMGETVKQAHLHYEVYRDGIAVDPLEQ